MVASAPFIMLGYAVSLAPWLLQVHAQLFTPLPACHQMFIGSTNPTVRYAATFMIASGAFSFGALCNTWAAINTTSDTARAATIATVVFGGNLGGLICSSLYFSSLFGLITYVLFQSSYVVIPAQM
jgi:hypothetical protein